jgi:DNA transposition AAA+ family ATPase
VLTRNIDKTHEVLKQIFTKNRFDIELRELNRPDEDEPMGKIVYVVNMRANVSTDRLSDEILSADADNIDTVEWEQKVSETYMYK